MKRKPTIAITMGDPAGIGPEVVLKGFSHYSEEAPQRLIVIGDAKVLRDTAEQLRLTCKDIVVIASPDHYIPNKINVIETTPAASFSHSRGACIFLYRTIDKTCTVS